MSLTDAQMALKAKKIKRLGDRIDQLTQLQKGLKGEVLQEMERRGTRGIETHGMRITYVAPESVVYNEAALRRRLKTKFASICKMVIDKDKLSAAVQEGKISPATVDACSEVVPGTPYVRITIQEVGA